MEQISESGGKMHLDTSESFTDEEMKAAIDFLRDLKPDPTDSEVEAEILRYRQATQSN